MATKIIQEPEINLIKNVHGFYEEKANIFIKQSKRTPE